MTVNFYDEALALQPAMVEWRRDLHRHPELGFEEIRTAGIVAAELKRLGIAVRTGVGKTGVVGMLEGASDGPTLLVRFDMDALPIHEANQTDYASQTPGKMHACGHDGHTSIGLAVARLLVARRDQMAGRVKFVFQPSEETGEGAQAMIDDGVLEAPRPDVSLGLHLWADLPVGQVGITDGPCMAADDIWRCTVAGPGGHGAAPHQTHDPILAAAHIVTALQSIASRNVPPLDAAVVSVGTLHGGDAFNIIPTSVELMGTLRAYRPETQQIIRERLRSICEGVAAAMGCEAALEIELQSPPLVNQPETSQRVRQAAAEVVGASNLRDDVRTMGAEDMACLMDEIPGCYFFVGAGNAERGLTHPHHNPRFDWDEAAMPIGAAIMAGAVASYVLPG
jgi:amidohydrolase